MENETQYRVEMAKAQNDNDTVGQEFACPMCGERRSDWLIWDDGDWVGMVTCQSCGCVYGPADEEWKAQ